MPSPWSAILILGGDTGEGGPTGGPFVLDLNTHTWSVLRCEGELPRGTVGHCSAAIDSRIYVFGGFDPHGGHRAPAQVRRALCRPMSPGCKTLNTIQAATLCTEQAYQNTLNVLDFSSSLPRWEVLVSDVQVRQQAQARRPGQRQSWPPTRLGAPSCLLVAPLWAREARRPQAAQGSQCSLGPCVARESLCATRERCSTAPSRRGVGATTRCQHDATTRSPLCAWARPLRAAAAKIAGRARR